MLDSIVGEASKIYINYYCPEIHRQRGITLDLGFSSFTVDAPAHIYCDTLTHIQYTLVDCPGHASLIKTIIGGKYITTS